MSNKGKVKKAAQGAPKAPKVTVKKKENDDKKALEGHKKYVDERLELFDNLYSKAQQILDKALALRKINSFVSFVLAIPIVLHYTKIITLPTWAMVFIWIFFVSFSITAITANVGKARIDVANIEAQKKRFEDLNIERTATDTYFDRLVSINLENLSAYYVLVKQNASQSFKLSAFVGVIGFAVLITGIVLGFIDAKYKDISYLSAAAGVITEMISGVFFYLYNRTVRQLKEYHDSLIDVQNILLSFKLIEDTVDLTIRPALIEKMIGFLISHKKVEKGIIEPTVPLTPPTSPKP